MSSEEDKMPIRRENTLASLENVPEELMDKVVEHCEAKRVADLSLVDRIKEGIDDVTTQISSQVGNIKGSVTSSNDNQQERTQEKAESPKPSSTSQTESKSISNDPSLQLKQKLESGEKINASELAHEFIHFIQEESRGDKDQKKPEQKGEEASHESLVHRAEEGVRTLVRKLSQTLEDVKGKLSSSREGSDVEPHHPTLKEAVMDFVHEISDEMTLQYDQEYIHRSDKPQSKQLEKKLAKFIPHHAKHAETTSEAKPSKSGEVASTQQISPDELKGFTKVESEGESTSKPQQDTKEEEKPALTSSTNPFDVLMEDDNLNVVAGVGTDITNKGQGEGHSSFKDKAKGKIDHATAKISHKVDAAKGKVSSALGSKGDKKDVSSEADKENATHVA